MGQQGVATACARTQAGTYRFWLTTNPAQPEPNKDYFQELNI